MSDRQPARPTLLSDEEAVLVDGCRRGDEAAWRTVYRAFAPDIRAFLRGMLGPQAELDDLVQKVFVVFLSTLPKFAGASRLRTWLHGIARNVALHHIRGRSRARHLVKAYAMTSKPVAAGTEGRLESRSELQFIFRVLEQLDPAFREVWLLREIHGFSVSEVAHIVDVPNATVRTRHHRARRKLLDALDAERVPAQPAIEHARLRLIAKETS